MPLQAVRRYQQDSMATRSEIVIATCKVLLVYSKVEWAALCVKMRLFKVRPVYIVTNSKSEFLTRDFIVFGHVDANND